MAPTTAAVLVLLIVITSVGSAASPSAAALLRQQQEMEIRGLLDGCSGDCNSCMVSSAEACLDGSSCPDEKTAATCFVDQIAMIKECLRSAARAPPASLGQVMLPGGAAASPPTALLQQQKFELRHLIDSCSFICWNCLFVTVAPCMLNALVCGNTLSVVICVAQQIPTMENCLGNN